MEPSMFRPLQKRYNSIITRRSFALSLAASFGLYGTASAIEYPLVPLSSKPFRFSKTVPNVIDQVTPSDGVTTRFVFGNSIQKLIAAGALDPDKFRGSAKNLPDWVERLLKGPSNDPIVFSGQTASYLVDLLWPLGLANKASFNKNSPIATLRIATFASTGGWTLGHEQSGHVYFNRVEAIDMSGQQETAVLRVATTTFRPCCDNSTFFQDCNHGSALLGLLELSASQGATVEELYRLALTANSFWFPDNYARTALLLSHFYRIAWKDAAPSLVLGRKYSTLSGWEKNVNERLRQANLQLPGETKEQHAC